MARNYTRLLQTYEQELIDRAIYARSTAFSPISGSQVGVAVLVRDGTIFTGANVEFARSQNIHAEWVAMDKVLKYIAEKLPADELKAKMREGLEEVVAIAEANNDGIPGCGPCRQMLYEINPNLIFYGVLPNGKVKVRKTLRQLYPDAYRSNDGLKL